MKKTISLALAALLSLSMAACGSSDSVTTPPTTEAVSQATTAPTTPATEAATEETTEATIAAFESIVLVDNEDITFSITGIEEDGLIGYTLKVFLENKTDKELMFTLEDTSVNGFMCDPFWAETVVAGKKSNTTISWFESDFQENDIESVEDITFTLRIYDNDDWMADDILKEVFTVNP